MAKETTDTKAVEGAEEGAEEETPDAEVDGEVVDGEEDDTEGSDDKDEVEDEVVSKQDLDKVKKALDSEREIVKAKSREIRELKKQLKEASTGKPEDVDAQKAIAAATKEASMYRDIAVRKEAALALQEAGAKVKTQRLIRLLDLTDVDIDEDGNVDGLADAIEELKEDSPEFFRSEEDEEDPKPARRVAAKKVGSIDAGKKTPAADKPKSVAEQMLAQTGVKLSRR